MASGRSGGPNDDLHGANGLRQLWLAAKSQKLFKATPTGTLHAEVWQLLLGPETLTGHLSMQLFEQVQRLGCNS